MLTLFARQERMDGMMQLRMSGCLDPIFMTPTSSRQFGYLIAYLLPGFIALVGLAPLFPALARWLRPVTGADFGLGPPLYAVLAATAMGLVLSCFRWTFLDTIHHATGVHRPVWNDRDLPEVLEGFDYLVQSHFRYYEFTGNSLVAVVVAYGLNRLIGTSPFPGVGTDLGMVLVVSVLFAASRDALAKYYIRTGLLAGHVAEKAKGTSNV